MSTTTTSSAIPHRPSSSSSTSSSAQPATSACAACKYQRRKCNPDCTLAPYFPADQHNQFLNAHRLFGVSNILKIIKHLDTPRRHEAMRSIIQQSNLRAHDPVGGCYRVILELQRQIEYSSAELAIVLRQLAHYRAQAESAAAAAAAMPTEMGINPALLLTDGTITDDQPMFADHFGVITPELQQQQPQPQFYNYFYFDGGGGETDGDGDNMNNNVNLNMETGDQNNGLDLEIPHLFVREAEDELDVKPLVDMFEIREEEVDSKDTSAFLSSSKTDDKQETNEMEHIDQEHDLKGAASLFTLTNCNTSSV